MTVGECLLWSFSILAAEANSETCDALYRQSRKQASQRSTQESEIQIIELDRWSSRAGASREEQRTVGIEDQSRHEVAQQT